MISELEGVYGDADHAALRLVTCGGAFDGRSRSYLDNAIVYAWLRARVRPDRWTLHLRRRRVYYTA